MGNYRRLLKLAPEWDDENGNQDSMKHTADGFLVRKMKVVDTDLKQPPLLQQNGANSGHCP